MSEKPDAFVQQLLAERAAAEGIGLTSRVEAVDKQLAGLGVAAAKRAAAAVEAADGDVEVARSLAPRERRAKRVSHEA